MQLNISIMYNIYHGATLTENNKWGGESVNTSQAGGLSTSPRVSTLYLDSTSHTHVMLLTVSHLFKFHIVCVMLYDGETYSV